MAMSNYPDTPRPMQLCAAIVAGMPVYEATGVETKKAAVRERFTQCLCDLAGEIYLGCYSIGSSFRISYVKLLNLSTDLLLNKPDAVMRLRRHYKAMDPFTIVAWLDKIFDTHEGQNEIEFKWMNS